MSRFSLIASWVLGSALSMSVAGQSPPNLSLDLQRIYFPEGRPSVLEASGDLEAILDEDQSDVLRRLLTGLMATPYLGAKVVGFADKRECRPSECLDLSLRRAKMVYDWFLRQGLPQRQMKGPIGESTLFSPPAESTTANNRRVEFEAYLIPDG